MDDLEPADRLLVALDEPDLEAAFRMADRLDGVVRWLKVGLTLFVRGGPPVVTVLKERGFRVFLDLKLHDIPHQVAGAVSSAAILGADALTLHVEGGAAMLRAAREARSAAGPPSTRLWGVTVLTSLDRAALRETGTDVDPAALVLERARLAFDQDLDGVVSSAAEVPDLARELGPWFETIVPGIRPAGADPGDQRRVASPSEALRSGATRLVVGRPITGAPDPAAAAAAILDEIAGALR